MNLHVLRLEITDLRRIRVFAENLNADMTVIGGPNGAGKSSAIDALAMALAGAGAVGERPVHDGEREGRVTAYIGSDDVEYIVTRRVKADGSSDLDVRRADNRKIDRPQAWLDALVGKLAFDPLAFLRMDQAKQVKTLRELTGLDFSSLDAEIKYLEDERLLAGRERDRVDGYLKTLPYHPDAPALEVSVAEIGAELRRVDEFNRANMEKRLAAEQQRERATRANARVEELRRELADAEEVAKLAAHTADALESAAIVLMDEDPGPLHHQLEEVEEINQLVRQNREHAAKIAEHKAHADEWKRLDAQINARREEKRRQLAAVHMPVQGLGFGEDGVEFNGRPLSVASQAEQIRVSMGMAIALCPQLRLCLIRDGSLLDQHSLALVAQMAREAGAQIVMERVGDGPEVGIVISEGMVIDVRQAGKIGEEATR